MNRQPDPTLRVIPGISPPVCPPPAPAPRSYEVRIRRSVGGSVWLIGHDRAGAPMMELRIAKKHLTSHLVHRVERWCREHDDEPDIQIAR